MSKRKGPQGHKGSNRRRQDGENSRQLDPVFGQYRALPVAENVLSNITPDTIPTDGETYLAMVRKQAEEGSSVMFIPKAIDYQGKEEKKPKEAKDQSPDSASQSFRDLSQFKDVVLKEFKEQREQLPEVGALPIPDDFVFPENFTEWRSYIMAHPPSLAIISNLDMELTLKLIVYATRWLSAKTPARVAQWTYSLLVRVPEVLNHSDVSVVRELGVRAKKFHDREELPHDTRILCATVLCIVGVFFDQGDLLR